MRLAPELEVVASTVRWERYIPPEDGPRAVLSYKATSAEHLQETAQVGRTVMGCVQDDAVRPLGARRVPRLPRGSANYHGLLHALVDPEAKPALG